HVRPHYMVIRQPVTYWTAVQQRSSTRPLFFLVSFLSMNGSGRKPGRHITDMVTCFPPVHFSRTAMQRFVPPHNTSFGCLFDNIISVMPQRVLLSFAHSTHG
ncbi:hypothetical protein VaNZ11_013296, partial [Volvox africanus]